jgi:hypothetical protein
MKEHKGMRPQDIVLLLKLIIDSEQEIRIKDLSSKLFISASEVSESLNRSAIAGLLNPQDRSVNREAFLKFFRVRATLCFPGTAWSGSAGNVYRPFRIIPLSELLVRRKAGLGR